MCRHTITFFPSNLSPLMLAMLIITWPVGATVKPTDESFQNIAKNVEFDSSFLNLENAQQIDLSRFANGSAATPGNYTVAIYVNNIFIFNSDVVFRENEDKSVTPCVTKDIIYQLPFNTSLFPVDFLTQNDQCWIIEKYIPFSAISFDSSEQRLDIQLPQKYILRTARGSVNPALWDSGIPAGMLGYNINGYTSQSHGRDYSSFYGGINAGINIGAWYLRHNGNYNWMDSGPRGYYSINTYLQRDIPRISGRVLIGESNTNGIVFDTLPFSGIQIASDDRMLPESQRGYAPDIHGVARTNARVSVEQNGQIIYETTVSPGEFLINDLYPTGYGGDLVVTVQEADGSKQSFTVPYASVAQLLRPGSSRYSVTMGRLRNENISDHPALYQGTYQYGINNFITGYGGLQASQDYYALQIGAATGSEAGAVSLDATQSRTHLDNTGQSLSGQSYRIGYSKIITDTRSSFSLAAYRFSTNGYMGFLTAMETRNAVQRGYNADNIWRAKNLFTLSVSQGLPLNWGQFYLTGSLQDYWNTSGKDKQYQLGYNNRYKNVIYGVSVGRTYDSFGRKNDTILASASFPLGKATNSYTPQMRVQVNNDSSGRLGEQVGVSGNAGQEYQFSYGITAMNQNQGIGASTSFNGQYRAPFTSVSGTYSVGKSYQAQSVGLSGSMVAHSGGLTFSPYQSDTFALVEAKGVQGAAVSGYPGIHIDRWGYALVPYLNPYKLNNITLDPKGTSVGVELENTEQKVAPYSGAVVKLKYGAKFGAPILITATIDGQPVPFGASVYDNRGNVVGAVGQGGQIYARVTDERGQLKIQWGSDAASSCMVTYRLIPGIKMEVSSDIQTFNSVCNSEENTSTNKKSQLLALNTESNRIL